MTSIGSATAGAARAQGAGTSAPAAPVGSVSQRQQWLASALSDLLESRSGDLAPVQERREGVLVDVTA